MSYYLLINRSFIVIDIITYKPSYIKLIPSTGLIIGCDESSATGVIGSDCNTHYPLISADLTNNPNAVQIISVESIPNDFKPNNYLYDPSTNSLVPRYKTPAELREHAYETKAIITWQDEKITVDDANRLWQSYTAEGNVDRAKELTEVIVEAKSLIRETYPDDV